MLVVVLLTIVVVLLEVVLVVVVVVVIFCTFTSISAVTILPAPLEDRKTYSSSSHLK